MNRTTGTGDSSRPTPAADGRGRTMVYELECIDCSFATVVEGDGDDALDVAESHQDEMGHRRSAHFVNFEARRD